jgi:hypothetical protein
MCHVTTALLQLDAYITPTHPATTWIPLLVIFLATAIRELYDDLNRLKNDCGKSKPPDQASPKRPHQARLVKHASLRMTAQE